MKKKRPLFKNRPGTTIALVTILFAAALSLSSLGPQEKDPLEVIKRHGTAGMQLQGDKSVTVRGDKLYVKSGKTLRPLFADKPRFLVKRNASTFSGRDMARIAEDAVKSKYGDLYRQSYKVHADYTLKSKKGQQSTVLCKFIFEHKNTWYAEERELEIDVSSSGRAVRMDRVRIPAKTLARPLYPLGMKKKLARDKRKPQNRLLSRKNSMGKIADPTAHLAAKRDNYKLDAKAISKVVTKYTSFANLPVYQLAKELVLTRVVLSLNAKGLANTAYPEVVTAKDATDQVHVLMQIALGSARKLIGPTESNKNNVLNYLKNDPNLVAWNNIGHGNPSTLCQNGTNIGTADLAPGAALFKGLSGCVCLINACQTFKDPLKQAIINHSPRTYIAGVLNLPMVTSEGSNPTFWYKTLFLKKPMSVAYTETNTKSGLNGYWGFWGDGGKF